MFFQNTCLRPAGVEGNFGRSDPPRPKWRPARGPRRPWRRTERDPGVTSPVPFAPLSVGFRSASLRLSVRPAGRPRSLSIGRKGPRGCAERDARFSFGPRLRPGGRLSPDKEPERSQNPRGPPGAPHERRPGLAGGWRRCCGRARRERATSPAARTSSRRARRPRAPQRLAIMVRRGSAGAAGGTRGWD